MSRQIVVAVRSPQAPQQGSVSDVVVLALPGERALPQRRSGRAIDRPGQIAALIEELGGGEVALVELNFRKSLEARAPASIRALADDLSCYARFSAARGGRGLPADGARLVAYVDYCEARRLAPATTARRLATLAVAHGWIGAEDVTGAAVVRDALRGMRRRSGVAQRQAAPLRLGEGIGRGTPAGFTLNALLGALPGDCRGLRDAALLSLGYDAGLRVSELGAVEVEHIELQEDGSAVLKVPRSKTDQEGKGAYAWLSPETVRRVAAWRDAASIGSGPLFRRIGVTRTRARPARRALSIQDLAPNARVDRERMAAQPARAATTIYAIGTDGLTAAAIRTIIKQAALRAADSGFVMLRGDDLQRAIAGLSTHSLRVGLTQDLFAHGTDAGPVANALRWTSTATALRYARKLAVTTNAAAKMLGSLRC